MGAAADFAEGWTKGSPAESWTKGSPSKGSTKGSTKGSHESSFKKKEKKRERGGAERGGSERRPARHARSGTWDGGEARAAAEQLLRELAADENSPLHSPLHPNPRRRRPSGAGHGGAASSSAAAGGEGAREEAAHFVPRPHPNPSGARGDGRRDSQGAMSAHRRHSWQGDGRYERERERCDGGHFH